MAMTSVQNRSARYASMDEARLVMWLGVYARAVAVPEPHLTERDRRIDRANLRAARREATARRLIGNSALVELRIGEWIVDPQRGVPVQLVGFGRVSWPYKFRLLALRDASGRMHAVHVSAKARVALAGHQMVRC